MRILKLSCFLFIFSGFLIPGQTKSTIGTALTPISNTVTNTLTSNILASYMSDTVFLKLVVKGAQYDFNKNNFPFYFISKTTAYNQSATPTLIIKKTLPVTEPHASAIKKYLSAYLSTNFDLVASASFCKNENLNHHQLFPFRLNAAGQVEELIEYDLNWKISNSNNYSQRTSSTSSFKNNSVLASGDWYKIGITQTGIYKISKAFLTNLGINVTGLDPKKIQVFGNGGKMLPELNGAFRYDDLVENAIQVVGEADGSFDNADYILFYATGPHEWTKTSSISGLRFTVQKNRYSDTSFYFITTGATNGKRITTHPSSPAPANMATSAYDYYNFHEVDQVNFARSGRDFYGEYFDVTTAYGFSWSDGNFVTGDTLKCEVKLACASKVPGKFGVTGNGLNFSIGAAPINVGAYLADYASLGSKDTFAMNTDPGTIGITISKLVTNSVGWLDKITINARRKLSLSSKQFCFRDSRVYGAGKICSYSLNNALNSAVNLWNVTDPLNPYIQAYNSTGSTELNFVASTDSLMEYCIAPGGDFYTPAYFGKVVNQNLHNIQQADYVIVTHPLFINEAEEIGAFHQQKEGLSYAVATVDQIYNEFSSGRQDISAIRDFVRMIYSRNIIAGKQVKYLLLFGRGSYNNITRSLVNNTDFIPTYQSVECLSPTQSVATDDFYGLMDPNEGADAEGAKPYNNDIGRGVIDIGVGRFTCKSVTEARGIIGKIKNYYLKDANFQIADSSPENCNLSENHLGDWRNRLLFLAEDGDSGIHMGAHGGGADALATIIKNKNSSYNADKIYLDAYQRYSTPGGHRYPDAAEDWLRRIKKGCLVFNYTGHGGEVGLTEERIIDVPTIDALDNFNKLPLFITATCEFSRYDDPARTSAGEYCLLNPKGAAIALLTTCRIAYSNTNDQLNQSVITMLFANLPNGKKPSLGDVVQRTKSSLMQHPVFANFHLLGDPAMPLAYPEQKVITSKINKVPLTLTSSDTLGALAKITVSGFIADTNGTKLTSFNGIVYPTVFDKEQNVVCLINDPTSALQGSDPPAPFQFKLQKNILYRGKAQVTNGDFSFTFIVPKDISFAPGPGKISYYATNGTMDANGYYNNIVVGGESKNAIVDNDGPSASLYFNDKNFVNGGITNESPILYANLTDSSGINTLGTSIGHDISAILDATGSKPVILNDYYEANLNSYQSGSVRYPFNQLSEGDHRLTFKVWDIQNNSNTVYTDFIVAKSAELALKHVLNYPNPFTTKTKFMFEHNQACNPLKVTIQIFTVSGKAVKTIQKLVVCEGFKPEPIEWDGKDDFGDKLARGVYIYKLAILDIQNKKAEKIEKLVILN